MHTKHVGITFAVLIYCVCSRVFLLIDLALVLYVNIVVVFLLLMYLLLFFFFF